MKKITRLFFAVATVKYKYMHFCYDLLQSSLQSCNLYGISFHNFSLSLLFGLVPSGAMTSSLWCATQRGLRWRTWTTPRPRRCSPSPRCWRTRSRRWRVARWQSSRLQPIALHRLAATGFDIKLWHEPVLYWFFYWLLSRWLFFWVWIMYAFLLSKMVLLGYILLPCKIAVPVIVVLCSVLWLPISFV